MVPNEDGRRLVEGRFDLLAALVAVKLRLEAVIEAAIDHTRAEYEKAWEGLVAASGVVIRETEETRRARRKVEALHEISARLHLTPADVIAVGDGANDLGMLGLAGTGVALR